MSRKLRIMARKIINFCILLLFTILLLKFLPDLVEFFNSNQTYHQTTCQPAVVGQLFNYECRPDEIEWELKRICITRVDKICIENPSPDLVEVITQFTSDQPEVFCNELVDVGEGDSDHNFGQYPYKLCKQWLPNPNNCIVYSFGYATTLMMI